MDSIFNLIFELKKLFEKRYEDRKSFFKCYIEPTYCDTKQVYSDLKNILQHATDMLLDPMTDHSCVVEYLKGARLPLQFNRAELRSRTYLITNKVSHKTDLFMFAISIRGILCGGMTGKFFQSNMNMIDRYINGLQIDQEILFYEGNHALLDLINRFDIKNNKHSNPKDSCNTQTIKRIFLNAVEKQQSSLDQYFKLLVFSYEKIKWETYSHNVKTH